MYVYRLSHLSFEIISYRVAQSRALGHNPYHTLAPLHKLSTGAARVARCSECGSSDVRVPVYIKTVVKGMVFPILVRSGREPLSGDWVNYHKYFLALFIACSFFSYWNNCSNNNNNLVIKVSDKVLFSFTFLLQVRCFLFDKEHRSVVPHGITW